MTASLYSVTTLSTEKSIAAAVTRDRPEHLQKLLKERMFGLDDLGKALHCAANYGREECARVLLDNGALPDIHCPQGFTPLILAAKHGHAHIVRLLVQRKCKVNKATHRIRANALHWAATYGHTACIRSLIDAGANPLAQTVLGRTPLMLAARSGQEDALEVMLETGCDVNMQDFEKATALHLAAEEGSSECVRQLLAAGATLDEPCRSSETPLMLAAKRGNVNVARLLVRKGADVNKTGRCMTPLHWAADNGRAECVEYLISQVSDPDLATKDSFCGGTFMVNRGSTPLMLACRGGHLEVVQVLLQHGCDHEKYDEEKMTPLAIAVNKGHWKCAEYLLEKGANPDGLLLDGLPVGPFPLFVAVKHNSVACVRALLKANCSMYAAGLYKGGETILAFDLALTKGYLDIVRMFISVGYEVSVSDPSRHQEALAWLLSEDEELFLRLLQQLQSPISLMQLCRRCIRKVMGKSIQQKLELLPAPTSVKLFLNLADLDDY